MSNEDLVIYGAGGAGRELAFALSMEKNEDSGLVLKGFIDDTPGLSGKKVNGFKVLGNKEYLKTFSGNVAVTIFDYPLVREKLISEIQNIEGIGFPNLISSTSVLSPFAKIGKGCVINFLNSIQPNAQIEDFVFVNGRSGIGHDAIVGKYTTIFAGISVGGGASIGSCCLIGSGTTILPKVKIGNKSIIAAGSVVTKNVPEGVLAAGVPAKIIRYIHG